VDTRDHGSRSTLDSGSSHVRAVSPKRAAVSRRNSFVDLHATAAAVASAVPLPPTPRGGGGGGGGRGRGEAGAPPTPREQLEQQKAEAMMDADGFLRLSRAVRLCRAQLALKVCSHSPFPRPSLATTH
jgi:hypothetical protein